MVNIGLLLASGVFTLGGAAVFWGGFSKMHQFRLVQDIPRSKIRSMAMGLVEIHGQFLADKYLLGPFSQTKCLYCRYEVQEFQKRGKSNEWVTIFNNEKRIPFWAKDETGQVYVEPTGAEFNLPVKKAFSQLNKVMDTNEIITCLKKWNNSPQQKLDLSRWNLTPISPTEHGSWVSGSDLGKRRYFEYYIEPEENLFVIGTASNDPKDPNKHIIKKGELEPTFIISDKGEAELVHSLKKDTILYFVFGALFLIIGIILSLFSLGIIGGG